MEDSQIIDLYWAREERAIRETDKKYGSYCHSIACNILHDREDASECVNDTYLDAWNAMPPNRPSILATFLGKITRRISIDRVRSLSAQKRGGGELPLALDELSECVSGTHDPEQALQYRELVALIRYFLDCQPAAQRRVFLLRYWYLESISSIAEQCGFSQSKVTSMLHRTRSNLRRLLEKEGYL